MLFILAFTSILLFVALLIFHYSHFAPHHQLTPPASLPHELPFAPFRRPNQTISPHLKSLLKSLERSIDSSNAHPLHRRLKSFTCTSTSILSADLTSRDPLSILDEL